MRSRPWNVEPPDPEVVLIVAGGPLHALSMSRTSTRADAISRGAHTRRID